jgi:hypothetical protein
MPAILVRSFTILLALLFVERQAQAYADPGSGALLWQMLVAGAIGGLFYVRRVAGWFRTKAGGRKIEG